MAELVKAGVDRSQRGLWVPAPELDGRPRAATGASHIDPFAVRMLSSARSSARGGFEIATLGVELGQLLEDDSRS